MANLFDTEYLTNAFKTWYGTMYPHTLGNALKEAVNYEPGIDRVWIEDTSKQRNHSGSYDTTLIRGIRETARRHGIDPYAMLATGLQESSFGESKDELGHSTELNPMRVNAPTKVLQQHLAEKDTSYSDPGILLDIAAEKLKEGIDKYGQTARGMQYYNGMVDKEINFKNYFNRTPSAIYHGIRTNNFYRNPIHGRKVMDYIQMLRDNAQINELMKE